MALGSPSWSFRFDKVSHFFISPCPSILMCPFSTTLLEPSYWKTKLLLIYQMAERLYSVIWNFLPCLGDLAQPQTITMFDLEKTHWREQHKTNDLLWCRLSLEYLVSCGRPLNSGHKTAHKIQGNQVKMFKSRLLNDRIQLFQGLRLIITCFDKPQQVCNKVTTRWEGPQSLSYKKYSISKNGLLCTDSCVIAFVKANV